MGVGLWKQTKTHALDCLLVDFNGTVSVSIEEVYSPQLYVGDCLRTEAQRNFELFNSLQHTKMDTANSSVEKLSF